MAITAKFIADFTSFYAAVQKAEVELKGLETGAGRVEKSLNKMVDDFGGRKLVQDATLMAEAVNRIGGAATLTAREQQKVNAVVTEAIEKYKALGQQAPKALHDLAAATSQVAKNTEQMKAPADAAGLSFTKLFGAFSVANLATSAVSALTAEVTELAVKGLKLSAVEGGFQRLATSVGQSSEKMLDALQTGTRGMVSEFDLMQSANKALLLGLPVTEESLGDMAEAATALGRAMGEDATKSLDDLITALGRSSPMILDNLGLTVKVGEANEAYARSLGKTADQLTDAEKKMAFYQAAMEAARKKTQELGEQTLTLSEIIGAAWTDIGNVITRAAGIINQGLGQALSSMKSFAEFAADVINLGPSIAVSLAAARAEIASIGGAAGPGAKFFLRNEDGKVVQGITVAVKNLTKATGELGKSAKDAADAMKALTDSRTHSAAQIAESYSQFVRDLQRATTVTTGLGTELQRVGAVGSVSVQKIAAEWTEFGTAVGNITTVTQGLGREWARVGETGIKASTDIADAAAEANAEFERQQRLVFNLANSFGQLGAMAGGSLGQILDQIGNIVDAFGRARNAAQLLQKGGFSNLLAGGVAGASALVQATGGQSKAGNVLGGAAAGAAIGSIVPGIGTVVGAGIGALVGFFRKSGAEKEMKKANDEIAKMKAGLLSMVGSEDVLRRISKEGAALADAWGAKGPEGLKMFSARVEEFSRTASKSLNDMVTSALTGGAQLDTAMVPFIEDLIRTGELTAENANLLLGLPAAGVPAFAEVEAAAEALGLDINSLGENIKQLGFTETAEGLAKHLDVLKRAGADMDAVYTGSREKLQKLVDDAQRGFLSLPESIKPFLQEMVDAGKLTDLFGNKLEDLDDLHFTKPLEKSVEDLIEALHELVGVIRDDVGGALDGLNKKVVRPRIEINPEFAPRQPGIIDDPTFGGRYPTIPGPTVLDPAAMSAMSATRPIIVQSVLDGRVIAESVVPNIPDIVDRYGAYR